MNPELLRAERMRQGWSQAKLAEEVGVDARTVRRWEQGRAIPFPYYRKQLCALFDKTAEELGLPCNTDENKTVEEAALAVQQPVETLEAEQLETPEPAFFSQMVADEEAALAVQQPVETLEAEQLETPEPSLSQMVADSAPTQGDTPIIQQPASSLNGHFQAYLEAIHVFGDHLFGFGR